MDFFRQSGTGPDLQLLQHAGDPDISPLSQAVQVHQACGAQLRPVWDAVAVEEPLEIRLLFGPPDARQSKAITVTMRTPGHDGELAAGFLLTEGVIRSAQDIVDIRSHAVPAADPAAGRHPVLGDTRVANTVVVEIAEDVVIHPPTLERNFYTTSSCGICGKGSLQALRSVCPPRNVSHLRVRADVLHALPATLQQAQAAFHATGGLHGAGLFDVRGTLLAVREDVGRHNALDKLLGAQVLEDLLPLRQHLLLLSGRASFELMQKAVMAGIGFVAAIGAPSSLAVRVAQEFGVALVGFLREDRFNVYEGADRIDGFAPSRGNVENIRDEDVPV